MMQFDLPKDTSSIIKVIGVGGGGSNAVNHMFRQGIRGVDFIVCNTDKQSLEASPVTRKVQLGESLTGGNGAGAQPEVGKNAAIETIDEMRAILENNTTMVFITAGMGGGTGTGAAPVIAKLAREMNILTVGIVTMPFQFEGRKRQSQAEAGLAEMREACDTLLVVNNNKLSTLGNFKLREAFAKADDVLAVAARNIAEVISLTGEINVDMNDVKTVMTDSGLAIMGSGEAEGKDRARIAVEQALESPLLNDNDIEGAKYVLLNITIGNYDVMMEEIFEITEYIQKAAGTETDLIWGYGVDEALQDRIRVSVVATGFTTKIKIAEETLPEPEKKITMFTDDVKAVEKPMENPFSRVNNVQQPAAPAREEEEFVVVNRNQNPEPEQPREEYQPQVRTSLFDDEPQPEPAKPRYFTLDDDTPLNESPLKGEERVESGAASVEGSSPAFIPSPKKLSSNEYQRMMEERFRKIRELNMQLSSTSGLSSLEKEPAINRKNLKLNHSTKSTENNVSRFKIGSDGEMRSQGNSFLHDNVD